MVMLFRLILLLAIAAGVVLFTLQNMTPTLQLMFLGLQSPALPLSWWVLGAIAAGSLTTLLIGFFFGLSTFVARQVMQSQFRRSMRQETAQSRNQEATPRSAQQAGRKQEDDAAWKDWSGYETPRDRATTNAAANSAARSASRSAASASRPASTPDPVDDWERPLQDSWDGTEAADMANNSRANRSVSGASKTFETGSGPYGSSQSSPSSSSYSYGYQNPGSTGVGQTEKVVDADYRVLVPPIRPLDQPHPPAASPPAAPEESADDWFEEGNDEFQDEVKPPSSPTSC